MAPEVLCKQMHAYEVDFYAIGIIAHELMLGRVTLSLFRGPIQATTVLKSEMLSSPSSTSLKKARFLLVGAKRLQIS
jgi:hypothetical protein